MRQLHIDQMRALVSHALAQGAVRVSLYRTRWEISGNCRDPHVTEVLSRPEAGHAYVDGPPMSAAVTRDSLNTMFALNERVRRQSKHIHVGRACAIPLLLELWTRCRRCDACRKARSRLWSARAKHECGVWSRTWFGTLTLRPEEQFAALARARRRLSDQGVDFDALDFGEQFRLRHNEISRELTMYLKRVRKNSGAPLRYLLVCEQHKSGLPHYHVLVHECDASRPVRHKHLVSAWKLGFSKFNLVSDVGQATYLCKYLSKSGAARVRASVGYGDALPVHSSGETMRDSLTSLLRNASALDASEGGRYRGVARLAVSE